LGAGRTSGLPLAPGPRMRGRWRVEGRASLLSGCCRWPRRP